jgi:hypothetical protein
MIRVYNVDKLIANVVSARSPSVHPFTGDSLLHSSGSFAMFVDRNQLSEAE